MTSKNIAFLLAISHEDGQAHFWRSARAASVLAQMEGTKVAIYLPDNDRAKAAVTKFKTGDNAPIEFSFLKDMTPPAKGDVHFTPFHPFLLDKVNPCDVLIVDTYRAMDAPILKHAKNRADHVILVDDYDIKGIKGGCADTVLNVCLTGTSIDYGQDKTVLTAPDHHLIQPETFKEREIEPDSVFVSFSTADKGDVALSFFENLQKVDPDLGGKQYNYTVCVKDMAPEFKPAFDALQEKYGERLKLVDGYDAQTVPGSYAIHIGNPGGLTNEFICSENAKVAGIGALTETSANLEEAFKGPGIPFADLTGILDGKNRASEMRQFAKDVASCLHERGGVTVKRPSRDGMMNFAKFVISKCNAPTA